MDIEEYIPSSLLIKANDKPLPTITIVFEEEEHSSSFWQKYLDDDLVLTMGKSKFGTYVFELSFPKHDGYVLGMDSQ